MDIKLPLLLNTEKQSVVKCHSGPIEVHPNLWLGSKLEAEEALGTKLKNDVVAVPLDSLSGSVWNKWDGEIIYIPVTDFGVLPKSVAEKKATRVVELLKNNKTVIIFCFGGHGRTGYFAALILGLLGYLDPIDFLRKNYCEKAVESKEQIDQIAELLNNSELKKHKPSFFDFERSIGFSKFDFNLTCGDCIYFSKCSPNGYLGKAPACTAFKKGVVQSTEALETFPSKK